MPSLLRPRPSARVAAPLLGEVFKGLRHPLAFRLWDGTEVRFGHDEPACVAVIKRPEIFIALMRDPCPGHFAEAYVASAHRPRGRPLPDDARGQRGRGGPGDPPRQRLRILLALLEALVVAVHDVVVVGGGPGGSTAAWQLARAGLRPLVLDAAVFPRVKICAGWVTPRRARRPRDRARQVSAHHPAVLGLRAGIRGARATRRDWRRPASYGIIRREFDHYLLERAAAAGADVRWGVRVKAVSAGAGRVRASRPSRATSRRPW